MPEFLTICRKDHFLTERPSLTKTTASGFNTNKKRNLLYIAAKTVCKALEYAYIYEEYLPSHELASYISYPIKVLDAYEAVILSMHIGTGVSYVRSDGKICRIYPVESERIYNYGIRDITRDIPELERLVKETRYIIVRDERRGKGSTRTLFMEIEKSLGIDRYEVIMLPVTDLGEPFYEALGGYVLRTMGYLVAHQGLITGLLPPPHFVSGVPDIEAVRIGKRGAFLYEISIMKELGIRFRPRIKSTAVGEVKGSRYEFGTGLSQLFSYLKSGLYDEGYIIIPGHGDKINYVMKEKIGLITWVDDGVLIVVGTEPKWGRADKTDAVREIVTNLLERLLS